MVLVPSMKIAGDAGESDGRRQGVQAVVQFSVGEAHGGRAEASHGAVAADSSSASGTGRDSACRRWQAIRVYLVVVG